MNYRHGDIDREIAEIEEALKLPLKGAAKRRLTAELRHLYLQKAGTPTANTAPAPSPQGAVHVQRPMRGNAIGVNFGTVQAFFGDNTFLLPDGKELLDAYLATLIEQYDHLRLGKLLGKDQNGREQESIPALSLHTIYTVLATDARTPSSEFARYDRAGILKALEETNPREVLPAHVRLPVVYSTPDTPDDYPKQLRAIASAGETLEAQWIALQRMLQATMTPTVSGRWYKPELVLQAVSANGRLVILGGPGAGKSTVLRHLTVSLAKELLIGNDEKKPLPVPLLCHLGQVAKALGNDPTHDFDTLLGVLLRPLEASGLRAGLKPIVLRTWGKGRTVICLDGLDEVSSVPEATIDGPLSRRERIAATIRDLATQMGNSRIVVTCRTKPYEQNAAWQLRDPWVARILEPFTFGQVRRLVPSWYEQTCTNRLQAKYTLVEAERRAQRLIATLEHHQRQELHKLTTSPLLLTMLVLLDYNQQELPEKRVDVYEEMVKLLLDRWEGIRSDDMGPRRATIGTQLGLAHLTMNDLRPVIYEIAFLAHQQAVDGRGLLSLEVMSRTIDKFFARMIDPVTPQRVPRREYVQHSDGFLRLLNEETGLIQEEGQGNYVLPHLTFEEYLAACYLAWREDVDFVYTQWCADNDRWREVILLLMGRLVQQDKDSMAFTWLNRLVNEHTGTAPKSAETRQRDALLAAVCYTELGRRERLAMKNHDVRTFERVLCQALASLLDRPAPTILLPERLDAATELGRMGDIRLPVTIDDWAKHLNEIHIDASAPNWHDQTVPYLCFVSGGDNRIGGRDERKPGADISLHGFWIARFPITVMQFTPFISVGYCDDAEQWWSAYGWQWKRRNGRTCPWGWNEPSYSGPNQPVIGVTWYEARAFTSWLNNSLAAYLPPGYAVRLPTEAEWEVAAAYDTSRRYRRYPWGDDAPTPERAIDDKSNLGRPAPVGVCPAGAAACGAHDLAGNIWEWTMSSYRAYPNGSAIPLDDFELLEHANARDVPARGGSWLNSSIRLQSESRLSNPPAGDLFGAQGFRIVVAPIRYDITDTLWTHRNTPVL
jgi:formylglycine-generating enzyme required for sulfatase activity